MTETVLGGSRPGSPGGRPGLRRAIGGSLLGGLAIQGALVVSGIASARALGPSARGELALAVIFPAALSQFGSLGLPLAGTYYIARNKEGAGPVIRLLARIGTAQALGLMALDAGALEAVSALHVHIALAAIAASVASTAALLLLQLGSAVLQGMEAYARLNVLRVLPVALYAVAALGVAVATRPATVTGFTAVWAGSYLASAAVAMVWVASALGAAREASSFSAKSPQVSAAELTRFGLRGVLGWASPVEVLRVDQQVVGLALSAHDLGIYVAAQSFANLPRFVTQSIGLVVYPRAASESGAGAVRTVWRLLATASVLGAAVTVALAAGAHRLVPLFYGRSFESSVGVTRVLVFAGLLLGIRRLLGDALRGLGFPVLGSAGEVLSWLILAGAIPPLAAADGLRGVAASLVIASSGTLAFLLLALLIAPRRRAGRGLRSFAAIRRTHLQRGVVALGAGGCCVFAGFAVAGAVLGREGSAALLALTTLAVAAPLGVSHARARGWPAFAHLSPLAAVGVCLLLPGMMTVTWNGVRIGSYPVALLLLTPAAAALLLDAVISRRRLGLPAWFVAPALLFVGAAALAGVFPMSAAYMASRVRPPQLFTVAAATTSLSGTSSLIKVLIASFALPLLVASAARATATVRLIASAWVLSAVANAIVAVSDRLHITHIGRSLAGVQGSGRQTGLTVQPNHLATACVLAIPVAVLWLEGGRWRRLSGALGVALLLTGAFLSGSRGGMVAAPVMTVVAIGALPVVRRLALRVVLPAAAVVLLVVMRGDSTLTRLLGQSRLSSGGSSVYISNQARSSVAHQAVSDFLHRPIQGVGFSVIHDAHDLYLQLLASSGVLGLCAFLLLSVGAVYAALLAPRDDDVGLARAVAVSICGWLALGLVENQVDDLYLYVPIALALALVVTARRGAAHASIRPEAPKRPAGLHGAADVRA